MQEQPSSYIEGLLLQNMDNPVPAILVQQCYYGFPIININNTQSNTTQLMILLSCISYIVSFNEMFRL
jgi:hypothetical protein